MGIYATNTSFSNLVPYGLKDNTTTSDAVGASILDTQIARAESVVNGYISARYSLPFSTGSIPPLVITLSEDLTSCFFIKASYVQDGQINQDYWEAFCNRAYKTLEEIKNGDVKLALTDGTLVPSNVSSRFQSSSENFAPFFNKDSPRKWKVSQNEKDAIKDEREGAE